jgi:hypothetical protein
MALHRYGEAAAAYYAVIAVVPGWDWTTMIHLYANPETYTHQLRMLETYSWEHPRSPEARFLCAIQYLTAGYPDAAAADLRELAGLQPDDSLTSQLLRELRPPEGGAITPAPARRGEAGNPEGTWTARPRRDTTIVLTFQPRGQLERRVRRSGEDTWYLECRVRRSGEDTWYRGFYLQDRGTLVLTRDQDNTMTGELTWTDPGHFNFKLLESWPDDPGLSFAKSP